MEITIENKAYSAYDLNATEAYCWQDRGYVEQEIKHSTRCLPDTANPSYQWGFSTMLVAVFLICLFVWSTSMYIVWQDAQHNSELVKNGVTLTELGTAFALTEAARRTTELEVEELIRGDREDLKKKLYGTRRRKGAVIEKDMFCDEGLVLRKGVAVENVGEV
jgi:hypothetical protein